MNANKYQNKVVELLKKIFPAELVKKEWDAAVTYGDPARNRMIYAPRIDVAVGPFNNRFTLDIGDDQTAVMKKHLFTRMMFDRRYKDIDSFDQVWNGFARCYLAIEIEFSGSAKHIFGSIVNAVTNGSLAFIIADKKTYQKVDRIYRYIWRQENQGLLEINTLKNMLVFEEKEFLELLGEYLKYKS